MKNQFLILCLLITSFCNAEIIKENSNIDEVLALMNQAKIERSDPGEYLTIDQIKGDKTTKISKIKDIWYRISDDKFFMISYDKSTQKIINLQLLIEVNREGGKEKMHSLFLDVLEYDTKKGSFLIVPSRKK